ncbi:TPA: hypothetical protein JBJ22_12335 [Legionella pneumophila]|nr:hypothetical protein [Legionella pneumophila]
MKRNRQMDALSAFLESAKTLYQLAFENMAKDIEMGNTYSKWPEYYVTSFFLLSQALELGIKILATQEQVEVKGNSINELWSKLPKQNNELTKKVTNTLKILNDYDLLSENGIYLNSLDPHDNRLKNFPLISNETVKELIGTITYLRNQFLKTIFYSTKDAKIIEFPKKSF